MSKIKQMIKDEFARMESEKHSEPPKKEPFNHCEECVSNDCSKVGYCLISDWEQLEKNEV